MEKTNITSDPLFVLYEPLVRELGLAIVEIRQADRGRNVELEVAITRLGGDAASKDCDAAYHAIYPVAMEEAGPLRDVFLTVETPGMLRTIKDAHEFELFTGRSVKVYDTGRASWLTGKIAGFDGEKLSLDQVRVGEGKETLEHLELGIAQIQKAKLEYLEEDWKDGR